MPFRLLMRLFFDPKDLLPEDVDKIRSASRRGTVVYVLNHSHFFDFLFFSWAFLHYGLPLAQFVNGVSVWLLWPLRALWAWLKGDFRVSRADRLSGVVLQGRASMICLRAGRRLGRSEDLFLGSDLLKRLVELKSKTGQEIIFVPLTVLWGRYPVRPPPVDTSPVGKVFGHRESPGRLRSLVQLLLALRGLRVKVADPLDLSRVVEQHEDLNLEGQASHLRAALEDVFEKQQRVLLGPPRKGAARIREELLRHPEVKDAIEALAAEQSVSPAALFKKANRYLKEIEADIGPYTLGFMRWLMRVAFNRIYSGLEVSAESFALLRRAAEQGPLLFLPSHKSHVDYLFVSWIVAEYGVAPPLIAAGSNLSFWPLGAVFRRSGAFFLRRTFRDNRLYTLVFTEYLAKVLREGYNMEFFIEGTRSRTGKVLPPRMGLLKWIAEHALNDRIPVVHVCPFHISYEKVIEAPSYALELAGGSKQSEDLSDLVSAGRVLGSRFGRLILRVDEPFTLAEALEEAGAGSGCTDAELTTAVDRLAHRIVYRISRLAAVTPTALIASALLATGRRTLPRTFVLAACRFLAQRTMANGAELSASLKPDPGADRSAIFSEQAIDRAVDFFAQDRLIRVYREEDDVYYHINDDGRPILTYYRNNIINFLIAESLLATAFVALLPRSARDNRVSVRELRRRTLELSRLFKKEFTYRVGATFDVIFADTLKAMRDWALELAPDLQTEALKRQFDSDAGDHDPHVRMAFDGHRYLELLAGLSRDFVEGYRSAAASLAILLEGPMGQRALERRLHERCLREFYTGAITRREACIRPLFRSAIELWLDTGVLQLMPVRSRAGPAVALTDPYAEPGALQGLAESIKFFENPPPGRIR